jgi:hypothetical protein
MDAVVIGCPRTPAHAEKVAIDFGGDVADARRIGSGLAEPDFFVVANDADAGDAFVIRQERLDEAGRGTAFAFSTTTTAAAGARVQWDAEQWRRRKDAALAVEEFDAGFRNLPAGSSGTGREPKDVPDFHFVVFQ